MRRVLDGCADCDICRFLMDESCLLFPDLYRLYDREQAGGVPIAGDDLRRLAERCTLCGLCPCPSIRDDVIRDKTERVERSGMPLANRLLADVQRVGRWGSRAPALVNRLLSLPPVARLAKRMAGIHPERPLPRPAERSFFAWARRRGLNRQVDGQPKVAYFAGCTAGYLFPRVARSAVGVLEANGIPVHVPVQECCGMPTLLEGDQETTLKRVGANLRRLLAALRDGYTVICSCPTCGYLMKVLLRENACHSASYQRAVDAGAHEMILTRRAAGREARVRLQRSIYGGILKDEGCFSSLDPLHRLTLADAVLDMGEYLERLAETGRLDPRFGELPGRMVYYAPCHQREQGIGSPYLNLLGRIPGLTVEAVGGALDCCGMGGSLGFKKDFHAASIRLGSRLFEKITAARPEAVVTDCLSCRLQFEQQLDLPVLHPLELLGRAYALDGNQGKGRGDSGSGGPHWGA